VDTDTGEILEADLVEDHSEPEPGPDLDDAPDAPEPDQEEAAGPAIPPLLANAEPGTLRTPPAASRKQLGFIGNLSRQTGRTPVQLRDDINTWLHDAGMLPETTTVTNAQQLTAKQASHVIEILRADSIGVQ
jgi:hypothetical protein